MNDRRTPNRASTLSLSSMKKLTLKKCKCQIMEDQMKGECLFTYAEGTELGWLV